MEFECSFGADPGIGSFYTCTVRSASIKKQWTLVKSFKGMHQAGKSNADVEAIKFSSLEVEYLPLGLSKIFPNLKEFRVYDCGLKVISRRGLKGLEGLIDLWLHSNQLKSLPDNLLDGMTKLMRVSFYGNKVEFVSSKLLQPIKNNKLIKVDFRENPINLGLYQPGEYDSLGSLQELCDSIDKNCKKPMATKQDPAAEDFPERIARGFKELWTSGRLSDFVIVCESKEFKVHKNVLAIQSSVLAAVVEGDMEESKTGRMVIKDFSKEAVEVFLKYLYTGETPEDTNAMEIFALATKYDVPALQFQMEDVVLYNIDATNALEILTMAKQHDCEFLAQAAFNRIQDMLAEANWDPSLIDNPQRLMEIIDAKRKYDEVLAGAKRDFEGVLKSCSPCCSQIKKEK